MPAIVSSCTRAIAYAVRVARVINFYEYLFFLSIVLVVALVVFAHALGIPRLVAAFLFAILPIQAGLVWFFVDLIRSRAG